MRLGRAPAALEWAVVSDPCAGMGRYAGAWDLFFAFAQADGVRLGERLLAACPARDHARALAQISVGFQRLVQVDTEGAAAAEEDARLLSAELGERALEGWAWLFQGVAATLAGAVEAARAAATEARDLHRELGVRSGEGKAVAGARPDRDADGRTGAAFGTAAPRSASTAGLSAAEVRVARLGRPRPAEQAIAAERHISVRTVESHVRHALAKAGLENRTQLATWARERVQ